MKFVLLLSFALVILTAAACDSDDDNSASAPTGTAVLTPSGGAGPGASPSVAVPPMPPATITPDNFGALEVVYERGLETPQFMAWQEDGRLLVASHAAALLIDPEAGTADTVYAGAGQEPVVAVSAHGHIATATADSLGIDIRDLTGAITARAVLESQFGSVDFSADGTLLAVSRLDAISVQLFDVASGGLRDTVEGFQTAAPTYSATLSPDASLLVWRSRATVQVTDLASGEMSPPMEHQDFLSSVAVDASGQVLAAASNATITLWEPRKGEQLAVLEAPAPAFQLAFFPQRPLLIAAADKGVSLWDVASRRQVATLDAPARMAAVSPGGQWLATVDEGGVVRVWAPEP